MKRLLTLTLLLAGLWLMPSSASAQFSLGGLLKAVTGDSDGPSRYEKIADKAPEYSSMLGTWYYASAKIDYFGDTFGADYAIDQLDDVAQDMLDAYDVEAGYFKIKVKRNGDIEGSVGEDSMTGSLSYDSSNAGISIAVTILDTPVTCDGYVELNNNRMKVYLDAGDLLRAYKKLGVSYSSSALDLATKLISSFDDIYIAIIFTRS